MIHFTLSTSVTSPNMPSNPWTELQRSITQVAGGRKGALTFGLRTRAHSVDFGFQPESVERPETASLFFLKSFGSQIFSNQVSRL